MKKTPVCLLILLIFTLSLTVRAIAKGHASYPGAGGWPSQVSTGAGGWNATPINTQTSTPVRPPAPPVPYPYYPYAPGPYGPVYIDGGYTSSGYYYPQSSIYHYSNSDALGILTNPSPSNYPVETRKEPYRPYGPPTDTTYQLQGTVVPGGGFILLKFQQNGKEVAMKIFTDENTKYIPEGYRPKLGDTVTVNYLLKGPDHVAKTVEKKGN